jgi:hypothetical protein
LGILEVISQSSIVQWVAASDWGYPIVLTAHALGMALVVGIMLMLDLRVIGFAARVPLTTARLFFPVAWSGFAVNLVSGTLLFFANYTAFLHNAAFLTKISLLLLGAIVTFFLSRELYERNDETVTQSAKVMAWVCLILWLGAIVAGRIVGYTSVPE